MYRSIPFFIALFALTGCQYSAPEWQQTRLYFGLKDSMGVAIPDTAWEAFRDTVIAKEFPQGFTLYASDGHWQKQDGSVVREPGRVLDIVYHSSDSTNQKLELLREKYKKYHRQQSVLRVDSRANVSY